MEIKQVTGNGPTRQARIEITHEEKEAIFEAAKKRGVDVLSMSESEKIKLISETIVEAFTKPHVLNKPSNSKVISAPHR